MERAGDKRRNEFRSQQRANEVTMHIDLSRLDRNSESETLELKESFSNEALETIGAFANAQGGALLIGVRDNGKVIGISIGASTLEEWAQKIQAKIQPRILPSITVKTEDSRTVGLVAVEKSPAPVSVDGRYFKRVGRTNQLMSNEEIEYRILDSRKTSWDSQVDGHANLDLLDEELIKRFIQELNKQERRIIPDGHNWREALEKLKLAKDGKPTRAAILLFGRDLRDLYPSAYIKVGRFKSATEIVDDSVFDGPLFEQLDKVMAWFLDRLERMFVFDESTMSAKTLESGSGLSSSVQREVAWEYPMVALREAMVNAICHRDYKADMVTTVRLFDNHLEIWNAGTLPPYLKTTRFVEAAQFLSAQPGNSRSLLSHWNYRAMGKWNSANG